VVLVIAVMTQTACSPQVLRESRKAAHRIQVTIDGMTDTTAVLYHDKIISTEKKNAIVALLIKANTANRKLIDMAATATADTPELRRSLTDTLTEVENIVKELKAAGLLGIKSKDGNLAFDLALSTLDTSIAIIKGVLNK
jgi:spore coat protein CotF